MNKLEQLHHNTARHAQKWCRQNVLKTLKLYISIALLLA
jgi:hypothetical protein